MPSVADLIEQHREQLIQRFLEEASRLPSAQGLKPEEVIDSLPEYLSTLAALSRGKLADPAHLKRRLEEAHIGLRLRLGYAQDDVTAEYVLIGRLLSRLWEALPREKQPTPADTQLLFDELQAAMEHAVTVFSGYALDDRQTEKRTLRRMDALAASLIDPLSPSGSRSERLGAVLEVMREAMHAEAITVLLLEPDGLRLQPIASAGLWSTPPDRGPVPLKSASFVAEVAASTELRHLPDATNTTLLLGEGVRASGIHSLLGLRMWPRGRLFGVMYLGLTEARPFEPRERRLFEMLVEHFASQLDLARLLQQLRQANVRVQEAEGRHVHRPSESDTQERLRLALEATSLGTWDYDPITGEIHWDELSKALFGLPPDARVDYDTFLAGVHPEDREHIHQLVQQSLDPAGSGTFQAEYRTVSPRDGRERWVSARGRAFFDAEGRAVRFIGTLLDITQRMHERQAAEREKYRATAILESISEAFITLDQQWRITYVNREAERLLGQPRQELLGRDHWELFPATVGTTLELNYRRAAQERVALSFENHYAPWDRWFELRIYPTEEGLAVYFLDITGRKRHDEERERLLREQTRLREQAEKALRERQRAVEVLEHGEALCVLDKDYRILLVNEQQERLSQTRREDILGRDLWEVFPATAHPESKYWREYRRGVEERVPVQFDEYYAPLDLWTGVSAYPTSEGGLAIFFRDVSERKRAEQFRERLVGIVSHDLRNPLHSIILTTELLLRRENVPEPVLAGVRRIARSADRMSRMITDLLDFTRARLGGGIPLQRQPTELHELIRGTLEELEVTHPGRIVLSHGRSPLRGQWDPDRLAQVVSNLVGNALQHGAEGALVEVALREEGPEAVLTVTNQGPPIPEALLPNIFDPFRRANETGRQGLGLGLFIVQQIVLAHGGSISVNSTESTGTTFTVRLPIF